jgi:N-acetyl-beta-hexosaminidase
MSVPRSLLQKSAFALVVVSILAACQTATPQGNPTMTTSFDPTQVAAALGNLQNVIPAPVAVQSGGGIFTLMDPTPIYVEPATEEITAVGQYLADRLKPATGYTLPVLPAEEALIPGRILLTTAGADPALGAEGYDLSITSESVTVRAPQPAGLFHGVQTIRQLFPARIESAAIQPGPWFLPTVTLRDFPRYGWRGMMLDVARHFFGVEDVKKLIDLMAYYKMDRLHLHLTDDQGWRIEIKSWPNLTKIGGSTEVGGGPGGFYTQEEYKEIVAYAQSRYIMIIPEIDMPGHVNAALASYPELNCSGVAAEPHTGIDVGFSSLCVDKDITFKFISDVIGEISALTPGPYIHIGGDEAAATTEEQYIDLIQRVQGSARSHGKQVIGWEEIARAQLLTTTIAQHWNSDLALKAAQQGANVIFSPSDRTYMDMKYDESTELGLIWAGYINVDRGYTWDPATLVSGFPVNHILGVEAPLWSETLQTLQDIEYMAFPRLIGYAEIGWSPQSGRTWAEYRDRLATHGPRLTFMNVNFFRSPMVPWK